ncbi:Arc family DNA-binding protein [Paracoccus nototheniae]|uniref:Arc family DNA-binding protein n=1 Tax=Paracoccus nototheniae TaxID=2489002 RepID=A0ABW4E3C8_9RHOB|nr:Arc family DNA-binding protein [Paracoccus nototheniae]
MTKPPSKQLDQFVVRLPDGMRDQIKYAAELNNRSMNAEIVARLEGSFDPRSIKVFDARSIYEARRAVKDIAEMVASPSFKWVLSGLSPDPDGRYLPNSDESLHGDGSLPGDEKEN